MPNFKPNKVNLIGAGLGFVAVGMFNGMWRSSGMYDGRNMDEQLVGAAVGYVALSLFAKKKTSRLSDGTYQRHPARHSENRKRRAKGKRSRAA